MSVLDDHLKKHRQRIIAREEATFRELLAAYDNVRKDLRRQILILQKKIKEAQAAGEVISPSWFSRENRLQSLIDQVKNQIEQFGGKAARITAREQAAAIDIAINQTDELVTTIGGPGFNIGSQLNARAVENAVGMMGNGSPILEYYKQNLAPAVVQAIRAEVINAAATGKPFAAIANRLMQTGDITRTRALATARTEVNRVRRETTRQYYQDNSDVITGWEWVAAKSSRTCPACLALDGRIFNLDQVFPQHVNCRCTMIPVIDGVTRPKRTLGSEWFDAQPDDVKEGIIGKDALAHYKDGIISLNDFVGWRNSREFGKSVYTKPLSAILLSNPVTAPVIRTPANVQVNFDFGAKVALSDLLGRDLKHNEIGGLVGAFNGAKIDVADHGNGVYFTIRHPLISSQERSLERDNQGRLFMHNHIFRTSRTAPKGTGLKSFATQVHHAEKFGVEYIETDAAGDYQRSQSSWRWNGYYTWPRMGYNAKLGPTDWVKFPPTFRGIKDLNELFMQTNGKFVWLHHGSDKSMLFDLDKSSRSWKILNDYLQERSFKVKFK